MNAVSVMISLILLKHRNGVKTMNLWIKICIMSVLLILITACGNQNSNLTNETPPPPDSAPSDAIQSEDYAEAAALYKNQCIQCHATDLSGRMGEQSNLQTVGARLSKEQIADIIKNGGQLMPAQTNLSDDEIELLAQWLSTKK